VAAWFDSGDGYKFINLKKQNNMKTQVRKASDFFEISNLMTERERLYFQKKWGGFDSENEKAIKLFEKRCKIIDSDFEYLLKIGTKTPGQKTEYMMNFDKSRLLEIPEAVMIDGNVVIRARIEALNSQIESLEENARISPNPKAGTSESFQKNISELECRIHHLYTFLK
jgi:hypothetical protein